MAVRRSPGRYPQAEGALARVIVSSMEEPERVSASVAAALLGVRKETVYAYVSRGVLNRTYGADANGRRVSLIDLGQVRALAEESRRERAGQFEVVLDTAVSRLDPQGRLFYRGTDAIELAQDASFEQVCNILWGTDLSLPWPAPTPLESPRDALPELTEASPAARARVILSLLAARLDLTKQDPYSIGQSAIRACAMSLGPHPTEWAADVATTVSRALTEKPPTDSTIDLIRRALVLLADHELATSTVATRAVAGTGASTALTLLAGAAALGGPLHGMASVAAETTLRHWLQNNEIDLTAGGFGHRVYVSTDPRAEALLEAIFDVHPHLADPIESLQLRALQRHGHYPNIDLALAALTLATPLRPGAGEGIFLIARLAGMVAHAVEEHSHPLRFRPRAIYTGEDSGSGPT